VILLSVAWEMADVNFSGSTTPASDNVNEAEAIQGNNVSNPIPIRSDRGARVGGGVDDPVIAQVLVAKAASAALRNSRKDDGQRREMDASARKTLHLGRTVEIGSKKRAREKATIESYFLSTRNFSSSTAAAGTPSTTDALATGDVTCVASTENTPLCCSATVEKVTVPDLHATVSLDATSIAGSRGSYSSNVEILACTTSIALSPILALTIYQRTTPTGTSSTMCQSMTPWRVMIVKRRNM
jgi:hypothetical protein